jgi:hypothetical protein
MRRGRRLISTWVVLACLAPVGSAFALNTPPGNSAANQYVETLPGASSNKVVATDPGRGLPAQVRRVLASEGRAGLLVLGLGAQAPALTGGRLGPGVHRSARALALVRPPIPVESSIPAVGGVLTGTGSAGLGWGLPAVLILMTVVALILAWRSRSHTDSDG